MKNWIKKKIKNAHWHKFDAVAPEGFILIPLETLERLKSEENWKEWVKNPSILKEWSVKDL